MYKVFLCRFYLIPLPSFGFQVGRGPSETVQAGTDRVKSKKLFKSLDNLFIAQKGTKNNVNNIVFEGV